MIRHKAMFNVPFIIAALCLGIPSVAAGSCLFCDNEVSQLFVDCCTQKMANNPYFNACASTWEELKNDLQEAGKVMKNGPTKENALKGALAFQIAKCLITDGNPNKMVSDTKTILRQCYRNVNMIPDTNYIKKVVSIVLEKIAEIGNVQQPTNETPQVGQSTSPSKSNDSPLQGVAAGPNQDNTPWNNQLDNTQQPALNFQQNPNPSNANTFDLSPFDNPYGKFQQPPGTTNNGYMDNGNQNQLFNPLNANTGASPFGTIQQKPATPYNAYLGNPNQKQPFNSLNTNINATPSGTFKQKPATLGNPNQNQPFNPLNTNINATPSGTFQQKPTTPLGNPIQNQPFNPLDTNINATPSGPFQQKPATPLGNPNQNQPFNPLNTNTNATPSGPFQQKPASPYNVYLGNPNQNQLFNPLNTNINPTPSGTFQQKPASPYNAYSGNPNQNQPFNLFNAYNQQYNSQGNTSPNQIAYQNNPLTTAYSNAGRNSYPFSYNPQRKKIYNLAYNGASASAASQSATIYFPPNDGYPYNPPYDYYPAAASSASSSAINNNGNGAVSSSSVSYSNDNSNQKPFPFNNSKKKEEQKPPIPVNSPQSESFVSPPRNQRYKWDNNPITQPETVKTSSVPQQTSPFATQNVAQENNWKINNQKNVPSTKDDKEDKYAKAMKFAETLYIELDKNIFFPKYFHQLTTPEQVKTMVYYLTFESLKSCGYDENITQRIATGSIPFMNGFPIGSPTTSYAEAICQMLMVLFHKNDLIGDDPQAQAQTLASAISKAMEKIENPPQPQDNTPKPIELPASGQNLFNQQPGELLYYPDSNYPNYNSVGKVNPDIYSNKPLNQQPDLLNKDSGYYFPQTVPVQNQKSQPKVSDGTIQPTDDEAISYDKRGKNENNNKANQSYASDGDKTEYGSGDNIYNVFQGQWQNQKQKYQQNTDDNRGLSLDDEPISYDKTIKSNSDKKNDQSYVDDKNQPTNEKQNKKGNQQSTVTINDYYDEYYDDYYYDDDDDSGKNDDDINPDKYLGNQKKKQSQTNDNNFNDNLKDNYKQQPDTLIQKDDTKNTKQVDNNPYTYNVPADNSKTILIPKIEQQKNKSNPLYLPYSNEGGDQNPFKQPSPLPSIFDNQQNSKLPDIGQKNISKAPETLKNSDLTLKPNNQTNLGTDTPVFQPSILDYSKNPDLNKSTNDESKARVEILKKCALDCMKNGKFDYINLSNVIADLVKVVKQNHPDWPEQKCQTTVLIEAIFGLTQLLLKSNVNELKKFFEQPQTIVQPMQLPPNSQQNNQNPPQNNVNPNYQSGQTNTNSQPVTQGLPTTDYLAPEPNIAYPSQNQEIPQNGNPNSIPLMQNTSVPQQKPTNAIFIPQSTIPPALQTAGQDNKWNTGNEVGQNNFPQPNPVNSGQFVQQPPIPGQLNTNQGNGKLSGNTLPTPQTAGIENPPQNQEIPQNKWNNNPNPYLVPQNTPVIQQNPNFNPSDISQQATPTAIQNTDQGKNLNAGNQNGQNNLPQTNYANTPQFVQQPSILDQSNINQGNGQSSGNIFPFPQTMNSDVGAPNTNNLQNPLSYPAIWPGPQQTEMTNPNILRNANQGGWSNSQSRAAASSNVFQSVAQGNKEGQNNLPQTNYPAYPQSRQSPTIPNQFNTNQRNGISSDNTFSLPQTVSSNLREPNMNNFQYSSGYPGNWPGSQQNLNNPSILQIGNQGFPLSTGFTTNGQNIVNPNFIGQQGNGVPIPNGGSSPNFIQNGNQGNGVPIPNGGSSPNFMQNRNQGNGVPIPNGGNTPSFKPNGNQGNGAPIPNGGSSPNFMQNGNQGNRVPIPNGGSSPNFMQNGNQGSASQILNPPQKDQSFWG